MELNISCKIYISGKNHCYFEHASSYSSVPGVVNAFRLLLSELESYSNLVFENTVFTFKLQRQF